MKTKIIQNSKAVILGLILTVGMGYALADFSSPVSAPPSCPAGSPGCDAPINVGTRAQTKTGTLAVGGLGIVGNFTFLPSVGFTPTNGQVLTYDGATGKIKWGSAQAGNLPDETYFYDSVGGTFPPPQTFFMTNSTSLGTFASRIGTPTGYTNGVEYSLAGKTKFGLVATHTGGAMPYIILKTNKRKIAIQTKYVRWDQYSSPVMVVRGGTGGSVDLGYYVGTAATPYWKTITLASDETPLTIKSGEDVFDNSDGGQTYFLYNQ